MKSLITPFLLVFAFASCGLMSSETQSKEAKVHQKYTEIHADGVVTPQEQAEYEALVVDWMNSVKNDAKETNWAEIGGTILGSVLTSFLGINVYRNRREQQVWGTPETPKPKP